MRAHLVVGSVASLFVAGCSHPEAAPAGEGGAVLIPVVDLPDLVARSSLACLGTVEAFKAIRGRMSVDSPFDVSVGVLRIRVLQVFRVRGGEAVPKLPEHIDVILASALGIKDFSAGEHHIFCLNWDPQLRQFVLPEGLSITATDEYRVPKDVVVAMVNDPWANRIAAGLRNGGKTGRLESLAISMTYLVRFYRRMFESAVVSERLAAKKDMYDPVPGHKVWPSVEALLPHFVDHYVMGLATSPPPAVNPYTTDVLREAGFLDEWNELAKVLVRVADRCWQKDAAEGLRTVIGVFEDTKKEWSAHLEWRRQQSLPADELEEEAEESDW